MSGTTHKLYQKLDAEPLIPLMKRTYQESYRDERIDPVILRQDLGISESAYFRILKNRTMTLETADKLCCALGLHIDIVWNDLD